MMDPGRRDFAPVWGWIAEGESGLEVSNLAVRILGTVYKF
jgi:hypothetical protein